MDNFISSLITGVAGPFFGAYLAFKLTRKSAKEKDNRILEVNSCILLYDVARHLELMKMLHSGNDSALDFIYYHSLDTWNRLKSELPNIEKDDLEFLLKHFHNIFLLQTTVKIESRQITANDIPALSDMYETAKETYKRLNKYAKILNSENCNPEASIINSNKIEKVTATSK